MARSNATLVVPRLALVTMASVLLASVSLGWLYWLRAPTATWPGPRLADALPLDELANHDSISVLVFVLVVAPAGLAVGAIVRKLRLDGFAVALSMGFVVGAWLYVASAVSIFVVRQDSLDNAFDVTRGLAPIYFASVLFACAIAIAAGRRTGELWLTRLVPTAVALLGVISVLNATLPSALERRAGLGGFVTASLPPMERTVEVTIGIVLAFSGRGLGRRSWRAFSTATILVLVLLVARIIDGFTLVGVIVTALVLLSLLARRSDFRFAGDPTTRAASMARAGALFCGALAYGVLALVINRAAAGLPVHLGSALRGTLHALVLGAPGNPRLPAQFAEWFPWSLRAIVAVIIASTAASWFAPWRHRMTDGAVEQRVTARCLVDVWGGDTLAPFTLRHDKAYFFFPEGREADATTFLAYRVVRGIAIVSGDPIGPDEQALPLLAAFRALCAARGWHFALIGAGDRLLGVYEQLGLKVHYHGDEAIVDTATFSLAGGRLKSVRQAVHRVARKGYTVEIATGRELPPSTREAMSALERLWLDGGQRRGFIMELDELSLRERDDVIFVIGRTPDGDIAGFLEIAPCPASASLSLSSMPRATGAANGLNAFLIVAAVEWAHGHGYRALSLNFSPAARLLGHDAPGSVWRRTARSALLVCKRLLGLQLDSLLLFNRHFAPRWQPRYVVIEKLRYLPRVVVATMAAERYLPFAGVLRGRDWRELERRAQTDPEPLRGASAARRSRGG